MPLHPKGDTDEPSNYRGITPLSTFGKLFTNIINVRLNLWAERYRVYIGAQTGFRKKIGTVDTIFILHGVITHLLNNNKTLNAAFVAFTKAFDYLVRDALWYKLIKFGIRGKMLDFIRFLYAVKVNHYLPFYFQCTMILKNIIC